MLKPDIFLTKRFPSLKWELGGLSLDILIGYSGDAEKEEILIKEVASLRSEAVADRNSFSSHYAYVTVKNSQVESAQSNNLWG